MLGTARTIYTVKKYRSNKIIEKASLNFWQLLHFIPKFSDNIDAWIVFTTRDDAMWGTNYNDLYHVIEPGIYVRHEYALKHRQIETSM